MNLENELAKFNPKQKQLLFRNLMGVELTKGCSVRCPDCGLGALKGVNGKIPYSLFKKIISENKKDIFKSKLRFLYFATEPFDYSSEGKTYIDVDNLCENIIGNPLYIATSLPKGKEKEILKYIFDEGRDTIGQISLMKSNYKRISKAFSEMPEILEGSQIKLEDGFKINGKFVNISEDKREEKDFKIHNSLPLINKNKEGPLYIVNTNKYTFASKGKPVDFETFVLTLKQVEIDALYGVFDYILPVLHVSDFVSMNLPKGRQHSLKLGKKFKDDLAPRGILGHHGVLMNPDGFDNIQTVKPSPEHPLGVIRTKISSDNFQITPKALSSVEPNRKKFLKKGYKIERGIRITDDFKGWFDVKKTNLKNSLIF